MTKVRLVVIITALIFPLTSSSAQAFFSLQARNLTSGGDLQAGQVMANVGDMINFDLIFTPEAGDNFSFQAWDLKFIYDSAELEYFQTTYNNLGVGFNGLFTDNSSPGNLRLSANSFSNFTFTIGDPETLATISLEAISAAFWDYTSDFMLQSQIGTGPPNSPKFGFLLADSATVRQFAGAEGPDVGLPSSGPPVPIPATIFLLASGFMGIAALKKRAARRD